MSALSWEAGATRGNDRSFTRLAMTEAMLWCRAANLAGAVPSVGFALDCAGAVHRESVRWPETEALETHWRLLRSAAINLPGPEVVHRLTGDTLTALTALADRLEAATIEAGTTDRLLADIEARW